MASRRRGARLGRIILHQRLCCATAHLAWHRWQWLQNNGCADCCVTCHAAPCPVVRPAAGCVVHRGRHHLHPGARVWRRAGLRPAGRAVSSTVLVGSRQCLLGCRPAERGCGSGSRVQMERVCACWLGDRPAEHQALVWMHPCSGCPWRAWPAAAAALPTAVQRLLPLPPTAKACLSAAALPQVGPVRLAGRGPDCGQLPGGAAAGRGEGKGGGEGRRPAPAAPQVLNARGQLWQPVRRLLAALRSSPASLC